MVTIDEINVVAIYPTDITEDSKPLLELCAKYRVDIPTKGQYTERWYQDLRRDVENKISEINRSF